MAQNRMVPVDEMVEAKSESRRKVLVFVAAAALVVLAGVGAFVLLRPQERTAVPQQATEPVVRFVEAEGKVKAPAAKRVFAREAGTVEEVKVSDGQQVTAGEVLLTLRVASADGSGAKVADEVLQSARDELERAEEALSVAKEGAGATIEEYEQAYNAWKDDHKAWEDAVRSYNALEAEGELTEYDTPPGDEPEEPARPRESLYQVVPQAEAAVEKAEKAVEKAQTAYEDAVKNDEKGSLQEVTASTDGMVFSLKAEKDAQVSPDDEKPMLRIADVSQVRVVVTVPKGERDKVREGQTATITFPDVEGLQISGAVLSVTDKEESEDARVELTVSELDSALRANMKAEAKIDVSS